MQIGFHKTSDDEHTLQVCRADGSKDRAALNSRSFLRHGLAHFAVDLEVPINAGYWGGVARGGALGGDGDMSGEMGLAEGLAGPVQTLMRTQADVPAYLAGLRRAEVHLEGAGIGSTELAGLAERIHERVRQLQGHWQATPYGGTMGLTWPE
jgi:hypothetical protein